MWQALNRILLMNEWETTGEVKRRFLFLRNSREFPETCNPYCEVGVGILGPEFS
jgi:hypothetical protein